MEEEESVTVALMGVDGGARSGMGEVVSMIYPPTMLPAAIHSTVTVVSLSKQRCDGELM